MERDAAEQKREEQVSHPSPDRLRRRADKDGLPWLRVDDRQSEQLLERVEITIAMEEGMLVPDAIRRNQQIDGLANGPPGLPEEPVVPCGIDREIHVRRSSMISNSRARPTTAAASRSSRNPWSTSVRMMRRDAEALSIEPQVEPLGFGIGDAVEVVDEDAGVDDDHRLVASVRSVRIASRSPSHFTLPRNLRKPPWRRVWIKQAQSLPRRRPAWSALRIAARPQPSTRRLCRCWCACDVYIFSFYVYRVNGVNP